MNNKNQRQGLIVYQSLSFTMIKELLDNENTPSWIKIWLYFSILQKYHKTLYPKNQYISKKLNIQLSVKNIFNHPTIQSLSDYIAVLTISNNSNIPLGTVKYALGRLKNEGYIEIINPKSWKRQIKLTHLANINDNDYKELKNKNENIFHKMYDRKLYRNNIYLTENEYSILIDRLKDDKEIDFYFTGLDNYLNDSTIKYNSHFDMLCTWINKNESQIKSKKKKFDIPSYKWFIKYERNYIEQKEDDIFNYNWLDDYIGDYEEEE